VTRVAFVYVDTSQRYVVWIESEALIANTGGFHAIHLTVGVRSAVYTIAGRFATSGGVANEAVLTKTFVAAVCVNTFRVGSARERTEKALISVSAPALRRQLNLLISRPTLALIAALRVHTFGINAANIPILAFVYINALNATDLITDFTSTRVVDTTGVFGAVEVKFTRHVYSRPVAAQVWCASRHVLVRALALVGTGGVETISAWTARILQTFIDIGANKAWISCVTDTTDALI